MSTNSQIACQQEDGSIKAIYCHWDGYPSYTGSLLLENYNDFNKINALISLGSLSSLQESLKETIKISYHFMRGEELEIQNYQNEQEFLEDKGFFSYKYLFKNSKWYFVEMHKKGILKELENYYCEES